MSITIGNGFADEITLSNGKKYYTGVSSFNSSRAKKKGLQVKRVFFEGCCISSNIMSRANASRGFPIKINGIDIYSFIENVASDNEPII